MRHRVRRAVTPALIGVFCVWFGTAAWGAPSTLASLCEQAAADAARRTGVPLSVLRAIALTETGRKRDGELQPWPWTVNMEGKGLWLDTRNAALSYVHDQHARGARSFDVGCFQINYRWHGRAFSSIEEMFDPQANALYAAKFLKSLFDETGDWGKAAGAYHSRTPKYANRYRARFERIRATLDQSPTPSQPAVRTAKAAAGPAAMPTNRYPLLVAGTGAGGPLGSLVPLGGPAAATHLFARNPGQP